jgi:predicted phage tail protein
MLEIADDAAFRNARIHTQSETTFTLMRREPGSLYFRVRGANVGGEGPWSEAVHVALLPDAPAWIETTLTVDGKHIDVAWGAVGRQVGYHLEMITHTDAAQEETTVVYQGKDTQCTLPLPKDVDRVVFQVRAEHPGGHSAWQPGDPLEVGAKLAPPALSLPQIEGSKVKLAWGAVEGATHYLLEVGRDAGFAEVRSTETQETHASVSPPVSGKYWFRVRACQGKRRGAPSSVEVVKVEKPSAPRLWPLDPVKANTLYEIAWEGVPGCVYYELQEARDDRFEPGSTRVVRVMHPSQKYTVEGHSPGRYYYRAQAVDEHGQSSAWSNVAEIVVE